MSLYKLLIYKSMEKPDRMQLEAALIPLLVVPLFDPQDTAPGRTAFVLDGLNSDVSQVTRISEVVEGHLGEGATFEIKEISKSAKENVDQIPKNEKYDGYIHFVEPSDSQDRMLKVTSVLQDGRICEFLISAYSPHAMHFHDAALTRENIKLPPNDAENIRFREPASKAPQQSGRAWYRFLRIFGIR